MAARRYGKAMRRNRSPPTEAEPEHLDFEAKAGIGFASTAFEPIWKRIEPAGRKASRMGTIGTDTDIEAVLRNLRQEYMDSSQDMLTDIDGLIGRISREDAGDEAFLDLRRHVHTIKGQGGTFGFPLISRIAHMLEDYIEILPEINGGALRDVQVFIDKIGAIFDRGESPTDAEAQSILAALPCVRPVAFTDQIVRDLRALVVMPNGLQRKIIGQELVSCGFRLNFADSAVGGLEAALAFPPHVVFASMEIKGFTGGELARVFHSMRTLMGAKFMLLTSYDVDDGRLKDVPAGTEILHKDADFAEKLVDCLMKWGFFGKLGTKDC